MEGFQALIENLPVIKLWDIVDVLIVTFLIYKLIPVFKSTGTGKIACIIAVVLVVTWLTGVLELYALNYILSQLVAVGLLAVVILFQPEIRRMIDHMSNLKFKKFLSTEKTTKQMELVIDHTVKACEIMSQEHYGALIVFSREKQLDEYYKTGTLLDAQVSDQLLRNLFYPKSALHDGAVILRGDRIAAAACVLPLSDSDRISADLGTRHRAALGVSEISDAVVVVVSEETGAISVATGGVLKRHLAAETLKQLLTNELCPEEEKTEKKFSFLLRQKLQKNEKEEKQDEK
ncbi:MAG: diadenylate cyclase CdaA [Oscillospiraceae bacterium]|nr:diadenylate cyclase CdaA [Oscillospiraceae bacterium]